MVGILFDMVIVIILFDIVLMLLINLVYKVRVFLNKFFFEVVCYVYDDFYKLILEYFVMVLVILFVVNWDYIFSNLYFV